MEDLTYWDEIEKRFKSKATRQELMDKLARYEKGSELYKENPAENVLRKALFAAHEDYDWSGCNKKVGSDDCKDCKKECFAKYYLSVGEGTVEKD